MKFYDVTHLFKLSTTDQILITFTDDILFDIWHQMPSRKVLLKNKYKSATKEYRFDEWLKWRDDYLFMSYLTILDCQLFFELTEGEMLYLEMKENYND